MNKKILIVGSGFSAKNFFDYPYKEKEWYVVAVNNAWKACADDWDVVIHAADYKGDIPEVKEGKTLTKDYSEAIKAFGGYKECGHSIVLASGYWCLHKFNNIDVFGFLGCDMNYTPKEDGSTAFYGVGEDIKKYGMSDPDRMVKHHGKTLDTLYNRFASEAERARSAKVYNFSDDENTRLPFTKAKPQDFDK